MKGHWAMAAILAAMILAKGSPALAHDGRHHGREKGAEIGETAGPRSQPEARVTIRVFQYQPERIQVQPGTRVTWVNEDEILHTVTAGRAEKKGDEFGALLDGKGKSFSFTFSQPGTYAYYCDRHEHMRGEIEVR